MATPSYTYDEAATIRKALQVIEGKEHHLIEEGFNQFDFTVGVLNCLLIAYIVGVFPQHFWLLYLVEASFLIPLKVWQDAHHKPLNQVLYYLDYCWVMNFLGMASVYILTMVPAIPDWIRDHLFATAVGVAAGALVTATIVLNFVAVVFHSSVTMTALFIHLSPPILLYTQLWHADAIRQDWPNVFHLDMIDRVEFFPPQGPWHWPFQGLGTIHGNAVALYFIWWILYCMWMLSIGLDLVRTHRHKKDKDGKPRQPKYDTVFHSTVRNGLCEVIGTVCWKRNKEESRRMMRESDYEVRDFFVYMCGHAVGIWLGTTVIGYACWRSHAMYAAVLWMLVVLCVYRGAQRYTYWVTSMSSKALEKEFANILQDYAVKSK